MAELGIIDNKNDCISDLIDKQAKNDKFEHLFSGLFKFSDFVFQVFVLSTQLFFLICLSHNKKKSDYLINMMQSLAFSVYIL